ncbi:uncharacterized protein LOC133930616 [Phragmites australis]|uniref:uncharacterized protein LOC133930616 n=1 Tax=Phragmites australis TaxID=29695 RepID=UPI002D7A3B8C|nr:uncharacterized protein LOC133930616 [Phragmites australis]
MAFMRYRALPQGELTVEEFRAWLSQFDADRDGRISREELQHALRSLNVWFAWWKARGGVRTADANRDGAVAVDGEEEVARLFAFAQRHLHVKITQLVPC